MKTAVVLILAIVAQVAGNILLSKGMHNLDDAGFMATLLQGMQNPMIWLGIGLLAAFFALYTAALSWADLSFILPATSFGYVLNVACAKYFLHEQVSPLRWLGAVIICVGVAFVSRSEIKTPEVEDIRGGEA
ncbi:MAG: EamA family transporter [Acidobacteria bacterium]|nr:EamA family transporter [Acidobacteriota bacterium]